MVIQRQALLGAGTRLSQNMHGSETAGPQANLLHHSFKTRYLIATMKKEFYAKDPQTLLQLMMHVSEVCADRYTNGVSFGGQRLKFVLFGVKGDLRFLSKIARMQRSFAHTRKRKRGATPKKLPGVCWLCGAGVDAVPFNDLTPQAAWIATEDLEKEPPWQEPPSILSKVLHHELRRPTFFKIDLFHVLNAGLYKEYAAG